MKTLKTILVLATMLLTFKSFAAPLPAGFELISSGSEYQTYFELRKKAIELIQKASKNPGNNLNAAAISYGEQVVTQLLMARFAISKNAQSEAACRKASFFVKSNQPNIIFVCGVTRNALATYSLKNTMMAAQLLIHEGAHLVNYAKNNYASVKDDECMPTYFELTIMENNFGKQNIPTMINRDGYKAECGFAYYDDVPSDRSQRTVALRNTLGSAGSR